MTYRDKRKQISISVTTDDNRITFVSNDRSITPENLSCNDIDFYLWGTNESTNQKFDAMKVSFEPSENTSTGIITLYIEPGYYSLTLAAVKKGQTPIASSLLLQGTARTDLRTDNSVSFVLTTNGINAYGNLELALYTVGWQVSPTMEVTVGIYDGQDDTKPKYQTQLFNLQDYHYDSYNEIPNNPTYNYNIDPYKLNAGTYNFKVTIKNNDVESYYLDKILIEPNRKTKAAIAIPNIISKRAEAPSDFIIRYQKPTDGNQISYPVEFCWTDNSNTEDGYQIEILKLSDYYIATYSNEIFRINSPSHSITTKNYDWNTIKNDISDRNKQYSIILDADFYNDSDIKTIYEGNLSKNSTYCTYSLDLGFSYIARICSTSHGGNSEYVYIDYLNRNNKAFTPTASPNPYYTWNTDAKNINLYRIKYELNSGKFYNDSTGTDITYDIPLFDFFYYTDAGTPIINPVNYQYNNTDTATLKYPDNSGTQFLQWRKDLVSGDVYDISQNYKDNESITLFADFGTGTNNSKYELIRNKNVFLYTSSTNAFDSTTLNNTVSLNNYNSCSVQKSTNYLIIALKNISGNSANTATAGIYDKVFSNISFTISEQGNYKLVNNDSGSEAVITSAEDTSHYQYVILDISDTTKFQSGKSYDIIIEAKHDNFVYSTTVIVTITE